MPVGGQGGVTLSYVSSLPKISAGRLHIVGFSEARISSATGGARVAAASTTEGTRTGPQRGEGVSRPDSAEWSMRKSRVCTAAHGKSAVGR